MAVITAIIFCTLTAAAVRRYVSTVRTRADLAADEEIAAWLRFRELMDRPAPVPARAAARRPRPKSL